MAKINLDLVALQNAESMFNAKWEKRGKKLTIFKCPHCNRLKVTRCPDISDVSNKAFWDSLCTCSSCGNLLFLKVYTTGETKADPLP